MIVGAGGILAVTLVGVVKRLQLKVAGGLKYKRRARSTLTCMICSETDNMTCCARTN